MFTCYMQYAYQEAIKAKQLGEIPVGCIIIDKNNNIVANTHNLVETNNNPNFHAEMLALDIVHKQTQAKYLTDYKLYSTLEPCLMCATAISHSKINTIYYGLDDDKQGAYSRYNITSHNIGFKPEIYTGLMENQIKNLMINFFHDLRQNKKNNL